LAEIFHLPEIKEPLALLKNGRIPVGVQTSKPLADGLETDPEDSLVFSKVIVAQSLFHRWSPGLVSVRPFAFPACMTPRILDKHQSVVSILNYLKDTVGMATYETDLLFILNDTGTKCDQTGIPLTSVIQFSPKLISILLVHGFDFERLREPAC
jgi:hypothetical protein